MCKSVPQNSIKKLSVETDVLIIGAGPVGLFAVFQCGMLGIRCCVVDALPEVGGQCAALYPEKPIYDIPAYPEIASADLIMQLEAQIAPFSPRYHLGERAERCESLGDGGLCISTDKGSRFCAKAVIIAAGGGAFGANRPPLAGIEDYEGKSVFYMVKRRGDFANKRIVIAGGGDSALDWCLSLSAIADKIYFVHRRDKFRGADASVAKLLALAEAGQVELVIPYQLSALQGEGGILSAIEVKDLDANKKFLRADTLLAFFGLAGSLEAFEGWGLNICDARIPVDLATQATAVPGIYAIGDGCNYAGKLKLILQGFSEAATAAHAIYPLVHPQKALHFEHSTTKGIPKM